MSYCATLPGGAILLRILPDSFFRPEPGEKFIKVFIKNLTYENKIEQFNRTCKKNQAPKNQWRQYLSCFQNVIPDIPAFAGSNNAPPCAIRPDRVLAL
jgi:hypothetical protein